MGSGVVIGYGYLGYGNFTGSNTLLNFFCLLFVC